MRRALQQQALGFWRSKSTFAGSARLLHGGQDREGPPAFAFDIDGVLVKGNQTLEPAKKALGLLYEDKGTSTDLTCSIAEHNLQGADGL